MSSESAKSIVQAILKKRQGPESPEPIEHESDDDLSDDDFALLTDEPLDLDLDEDTEPMQDESFRRKQVLKRILGG